MGPDHHAATAADAGDDDHWPIEVASHHVDPGWRAVIQGVGCVAARLPDELAAQGIERPLLVCGAQVARSPAFATLHETLHRALGRAPLVFDGSAPHSPSESIEAGAAVARARGVDAFVAVGGSSSIDAAKGMAVLLATGRARVADLQPPARGGLGAPMTAAPGVPRVPVLSATTTLSYAEFFPFWGTRLAATGAKAGYGDHGAVRRTIFLDGALAACTPDTVWFETAVKSLDDALLAHLRSTGDEPFLDPLLVAGIRGVVEHLPSSRATGDPATDAARRQRVLTAMALTKYPAPRLRSGFPTDWFARAVRYALGSRLGASHGVGTCIAMAPGLAFHHADTATRQASLAAALDAPDGDLAAHLAAAIAPLGLARCLDELGVDDAQIELLVDDIVTSMPGLGSRAAVHAAVTGLRAGAGPVSSRP